MQTNKYQVEVQGRVFTANAIDEDHARVVLFEEVSCYFTNPPKKELLYITKVPNTTRTF